MAATFSHQISSAEASDNDSDHSRLGARDDRNTTVAHYLYLKRWLHDEDSVSSIPVYISVHLDLSHSLMDVNEEIHFVVH